MTKNTKSQSGEETLAPSLFCLILVAFGSQVSQKVSFDWFHNERQLCEYKLCLKARELEVVVSL